MKIQHRPFFRVNSLVSLALLVVLGVVVTTVAQADGGISPHKGVSGMDWGARTYALPAPGPAAGRFGGHGERNTWLLADGVRASFEDGMYHLRLQSAGNGRVAGWGWPRRLSLMLSVGYGDEDQNRSFSGHDDGTPDTGYADPLHLGGPMLLMSVGGRW